MHDTQLIEWPLFYKDQLIVGNRSSTIAICTLWTRKEIVAQAVDKNKIAAIGNLYTVDGISYMIKNILANPSIRHIILVGEDLMGAGQAFIEFMKNGIEDNYKIVGKEAYIHSSIPKQYLDIFRKEVEIVDMRNQPFQDIEKRIQAIEEQESRNPRGPFSNPVILREEGSSPEYTFAIDAGFRISGETLSETWLNALDIVLKFGEIKESEYKIKQKEVADLVSVINGDEEENLPEYIEFSKQDLDAYVDSFFSPSKPSGVEYTYGERLFSYMLGDRTQEKAGNELSRAIDQIKIAEEKLKKVPFTRRAIAVTWNVKQDLDSENPPCLINLLFNVKFGRLYTTAEFRSHDIFGAWFLNAYAIRKLQKKIAQDLSLKTGSLVIISVSAHIYENKWQKAKEILDKYFHKKPMKFVPDPLGYFVISIDKAKGRIIVKHKLNDGRDSGYTFEGNSAESIYKEVSKEHLFSRFEHAAYLGKELERAEQALRSGSEYVQDSA